MKTPTLFLGIDFGTSNCSVAYTFNDPRQRDSKFVNVELAKFRRGDADDDSSRFPTVLSAPFDKRRRKTPLLGWDFCRDFFGRKKAPPLLRHGRDFFRSVKSDLGSHRVYPWAFSSEYNTPARVAAAILRHLLRETREMLQATDLREAKIVITVPASLGAAAREDMRRAAIDAGLRTEQFEFLDEPIAALLDLLNTPKTTSLLGDEGALLAVFDYGGGTLDVSLVRARFDEVDPTGLCVENVAISKYSRLGGDAVDRSIMNDVVWPQIEAVLESGDRGELSPGLRRQIEDTLTSTVARELKERMCREVADRLRQKKGWDAVDRASITVEAGFEGRGLPLAGLSAKMPPRFKMSRDEFESLMRPFLCVPDPDSEADTESRSLLVPLVRMLEEARLEPSDLDWIILHGGSTRNPYVERLLRDALAAPDSLFSQTRIESTPDRDASVARGAAIACYWKHARGVSRVAPVVPEEIGVVTLGDQPVQLVKGGQRLPFPDADGVHAVPTMFAVPKDRQRVMLVPFYTGAELVISGTVRVELPPNVKRGDPVRLKLRIDGDKILHWWCSVADGPDTPQQALNDPWTAWEPTSAVRRLSRHREKIETVLEQTGEVPLSLHVEECIALWQCRQLDELELLIADIYESAEAADKKAAATLANLRALTRCERGDTDGAIADHMIAVQLNPSDAVLRGNLGCMLDGAGRSEEAVSHIRAALGINPGLSYLYSRLGDVLRRSGNETAARKEFDEAIRIAEKETSRWPDSQQVWATLSHLYQKTGQYEKARESFRCSTEAARNEMYDGDHTLRIAGPDSGFLPPLPFSE